MFEWRTYARVDREEKWRRRDEEVSGGRPCAPGNREKILWKCPGWRGDFLLLDLLPGYAKPGIILAAAAPGPPGGTVCRSRHRSPPQAGAQYLPACDCR